MRFPKQLLDEGDLLSLQESVSFSVVDERVVLSHHDGKRLIALLESSSFLTEVESRQKIATIRACTFFEDCLQKAKTREDFQRLWVLGIQISVLDESVGYILMRDLPETIHESTKKP